MIREDIFNAKYRCFRCKKLFEFSEVSKFKDKYYCLNCLKNYVNCTNKRINLTFVERELKNRSGDKNGKL